VNIKSVEYSYYSIFLGIIYLIFNEFNACNAFQFSINKLYFYFFQYFFMENVEHKKSVYFNQKLLFFYDISH